jgi:excisionase family DNA binding protein
MPFNLTQEKDLISALEWIEWAARTLRTEMNRTRQEAYNKQHGIIPIEQAAPQPAKPADDGFERWAIPVSEAARKIGISRGKLYQMIARGEIASIEIGKRRLIAVEALRSFLAEATVNR